MRKRKVLFITTSFSTIAVAALIVFLYSFKEPVNKTTIEAQAKRLSNPINKQLVDSGICLLQTGDIILRTGADITSYMFTQMNKHDKTYSHCGIVIVENGYPFVYHSIGGEDNPDQIIKKDSANFWVSPANNLGYGIVRYSIDSLQIRSIIQTTLRFYKEKKRFDMDFDLKTDDRLYCTEFVYKVMNCALENNSFIKPSKMFGYSFVSVDNLFLNNATRFICKVRYK